MIHKLPQPPIWHVFFSEPCYALLCKPGSSKSVQLRHSRQSQSKRSSRGAAAISSRLVIWELRRTTRSLMALVSLVGRPGREVRRRLDWRPLALAGKRPRAGGGAARKMRHAVERRARLGAGSIGGGSDHGRSSSPWPSQRRRCACFAVYLAYTNA
jgi:hypothetical protein